MKETISRKDDEKYVYQPKIHIDRIKALYLIKEQTGIPMTVLLDRAIAEYMANFDELGKESKIVRSTPSDP